MTNKTIATITTLFCVFGFVSLSAMSAGSTSYNNDYSKCMNSPETQFNIGYYKLKYSNLSNNNIAHIICK